MKLLRSYTEDGMKVNEYTLDGVTVHRTTRVVLQTVLSDPIEPQISIEEELLLETKYQTILLENIAFGGI